MYLGSVRFFKHLILTIFALAIIVPTVFAFRFALQNQSLRAALEESQHSQEDTPKNEGTPSVDGEKIPVDFPEDNGGDSAQLPPDDRVTASGGAPELEQLGGNTETLDYQTAYPSVHIERKAPVAFKDNDTGVYLTFDNGPTAYTGQILDTLKEYNVKATFFAVGNDDEESKAIYQRIVEEGHTLGILSSGHEFRELYQSPEAYMNDFAVAYTQLTSATGVAPTLVRFPGGSINSYNRNIYQAVNAEILRRGFIYHDWNICGDEKKGASSNEIARQVISGVQKNQKSVVLLHDDRNETVKALPRILDELLEQGYHLGKLDETVKPFVFSYTE